MRYRADVAVDAFNRREGIHEHHVASVSAYPIANERLAARHARAMAAVLRASMAVYRAERALVRADERCTLREDNEPHRTRIYRAKQQREAATRRLKKVEKEVGRGSK